MQDVNLGATDFAPLDPPPFSSLAVQREKLPATMSERVKYARKASARVSYAPASESSDDSDADDHEKRKAGSAGERERPEGGRRYQTAELTSCRTQVAAPVSRARVPLSPIRTATRRAMKAKLPRSRARSVPKSLRSARRTPNRARKRRRADSSRGSRSCRSSCSARSVWSLFLAGRGHAAEPTAGRELQICSHLAPVDLLSLQLVNKHFYRLITAKAFQSVWATARRRLGLPDVGGISEAQYATFVFGKACQSCGVKKLSLVRHDYHLRRILCKACRHQRIVKVSRLQKDQPDLLAKLHPLTLQAVNRTACVYTSWSKLPIPRAIAPLTRFLPQTTLGRQRRAGGWTATSKVSALT